MPVIHRSHTSREDMPWVFIRGNLFDRQHMRSLPYNMPGPENDLAERIYAFVQRAIDDELSTPCASGGRWGSEAHERDKYFWFYQGTAFRWLHPHRL